MKKYIMDILAMIGIVAMLVALSLTEYVNELHAWLGLSVALILAFCLIVKLFDFVTIISKAFKKKKRS